MMISGSFAQAITVLGARAESTGAWFANVLADIEYDGADFTLRNLRVEPTTVV